MATTIEQSSLDPLEPAFETARAMVRTQFPDYETRIKDSEVTEEDAWQTLVNNWTRYVKDNPQHRQLQKLVLPFIAVAVLSSIYNSGKSITAPAMMDIIKDIIEWWIKTTSP
jgi:hypothetical protein